MPKQNKGLAPGENVPDFELPSIDGQLFKNQDFLGKPLIIYFMRGTWCPNCRKQLKKLAAHYEKYKVLDVNIITIFGQKQSAAVDYFKKNPVPFTVLIDDNKRVIKSFDVFNPINFDAFQIAHPSMFLISPEGKIVYSYVGENQADRPTDDLTYAKVHELFAETIGET